MQNPRKNRTLLFLLLGAVALLLLCAWYLFLYEPPYAGTLIAPYNRTLVFAHRGFGTYGPDNSLYAAARALESGADGVDVDGQLTKDGALVIFHDLSVDRLTSDTGRVAEKTAKEMLSLDLGPKYDPLIIGAYVKTFEDFVEAMKGKGILMVELKVTGLAPTGIEKKAVDVIKKHDAFDSVFLSSFNPLVLYRVKQLDSRVRTVFIFMDTNWNAELLAEIKPSDLVTLPWFLRQEFIRRAIRKFIKPDLLSINYQVDPATINRLAATEWPIFLWTPDTKEAIQNSLAKKPYGVISDDPLLTKQLRNLKIK